MSFLAVKKRLKAYSQLMRLEKPIGSLLLLWPTLWALWLAGAGHPPTKIVSIFLLGVLVMRSAGCLINDMADRRFDRHVARTRDRPLTAGRVSILEALFLLAFLLSVALWLVCHLNRLCLYLSFAALAMAAVYPLMKRFFHAPQSVLGLAFAWAVPMAFAAIQDRVPVLAWYLFAATFCWVVAYDTAYAMADRKDDLSIGLHSTAISLGRFDRVGIILLQAMMLVLLCVVGSRANLREPYWSSLVGAGLLFTYQFTLIKDRHPARCFQAFLNNQWVGLLVFVGVFYSLY